MRLGYQGTKGGVEPATRMPRAKCSYFGGPSRHLAVYLAHAERRLQVHSKVVQTEKTFKTNTVKNGYR